MRSFIVSAIVAAIAIAIAAIILPQIDYGDSPGTLAVVAIIFGLVNGLVKPIVRLLALPLRMATLGLISFVINAALLLLVAWLSTNLGFTFTIDTFPPDWSAGTLVYAIIAAVIISVVTTAAGLVIRD